MKLPRIILYMFWILKGFPRIPWCCIYDACNVYRVPVCVIDGLFVKLMELMTSHNSNMLLVILAAHGPRNYKEANMLTFEEQHRIQKACLTKDCNLLLWTKDSSLYLLISQQN
uniref:Uncharacterized protein n=1 Tax=Salix viminalis TaxID=40686 RepID=A0A6N2LPN3_SALVM